MKSLKVKTSLIIIFMFITQIGLSQQIEFGPNLGYGFTNIANSRIYEGRAVIGDALWNLNKGFSVIYHFNNSNLKVKNGIHFEYLISQRGTKSENYSGNEYSFKSNSFNLTYRRSGSLKNNFGIYGDLGFGYNSLDNKNIYKGETNELTAFERIKAPLLINDSEVTFLFAIGLEKFILKNNFVLFLEFNGDAGITKINQNSGSFRTQSLGFSTGIRYIIKLKKV